MAEKPKGVYVPLDVLITDDEDIAKAGMFGFALYVSGLTYAKRRKTDGFIPKSIVTRLLIAPTLEELEGCHAYVTRLCESGLWDEVGDGYQIRNWPAWNPTDDDRERWAERKRKSRASHADVPESVATEALSEAVPLMSRNGHEKSRLEVEGKGSRREVKPSAAKLRYTPAFEAFWAAYPVKLDKGHAVDAFETALRKTTLEELIAGAHRYRAWLRSNPDTRPKYAQGWLKGERWLDELTDTDDTIRRLEEVVR